MYRKQILSIVIIGLLFLSRISLAQEKGSTSGNENKKAQSADILFSIENYWEALPIYKELADANPTNVKYNNRAGICYFFSSHKTKCIPYFEAAVKNWGTDTIPEVYYYLGVSYQWLNQFDKAISYYTMLKQAIKPEKNGNSSLNDVERAIASCNVGKKYVQDPTSVRIFNLGPTINTNDPEYAPVISADESKIIFTSKRKEGTGDRTTPDGYYYEDIYIADKLSEGWQVQVLDSTEKKSKHSLFYIFWSKARKIGSSINTKDHDAAISLSPDGKNLFIYRDNFILESAFDGKKWGTPVKLDENVNEKRSFQPSCSMTNDGTLLYIVSDRPGGYGGKDIYVSTKQADGSWGPCVNLGEDINTEYDEDSPFITADGKTLYFSSQGHENMGGYDIFKSELVNGKWSKPENLGYPTNTGADDIFFVMNKNETRAYFSSIKDDTYGDYDIYLLSFVPETHLYATVKDSMGSTTPINTVVKARGHKSAADTTSYTVCRTPGRHKLALLAPDDYTITIDAPGYKSHSFDVKVPEQSYKKPFYNEVNYQTFMTPDSKPKKQIVTLYSAFFDVDSVVNADPKLAAMSDRQAAYSAMVKSIDPGNTKLNFKVYTYTDVLIQDIALSKDSANKSGTTTSTLTMSGTGTTTSGTSSGTTATGTVSGTPGVTETADGKKFDPVQFDFSKSLLREEVRPELDAIYNYLKENKNLKMEVSGHTDEIGSDQFNEELSIERATATVNYFITKGIDPARLKAVGKGKSQPVAPNVNPDNSDNPEGRQKNRRVEFKIIASKN